MTNSPLPVPSAARDATWREEAARRDAARERVVRLLTDRYADDTLTVDAFEAQLDRMHALTDPAALDAMARELEPPPDRRPDGSASAPTLSAYPTRLVGYPPHDAGGHQLPASGWVPTAPSADDRVIAVMSSVKRRGPWTVPSSLHAVAVMGEMVLDLREATLPPACDIVLFALLANVQVILPPGVDALVTLDAVVGSADDRTRRRLPNSELEGGPRVRVTGTAILGEVKVLGG